MRHLEEGVSLEEIVARYFSDLDLVLVEGYKELPLPKIEVIRSGQKPVCSPDGLLAVVSDDRHDGVPCFRPDDITGLASFLETRVLRSTT
jgi:molybdopterin-guanine dinucleotide biosynthesis protein B